LIDVWVAVSGPRLKLLTDTKQPIPDPVMVKGLVDTGSSHTTIDSLVAKSLGLTPKGVAKMITPSTGPTPSECLTYDVSLHVPLGKALVWSRQAWIVASADLVHQGFSVLIGRDVLAEGLLIYDGKHNVFTMSF
jgi:hypothetical protein